MEFVDRPKTSIVMTAGRRRRRTVARVILAGPAAICLTVLTVACMSIWFPKGAAGIDNIALPIILLPGIWAIFFFYALLDRSLARIGIVTAGLATLNVAMLIWRFITPT